MFSSISVITRNHNNCWQSLIVSRDSISLRFSGYVNSETVAIGSLDDSLVMLIQDVVSVCEATFANVSNNKMRHLRQANVTTQVRQIPSLIVTP